MNKLPVIVKKCDKQLQKHKHSYLFAAFGLLHETNSRFMHGIFDKGREKQESTSQQIASQKPSLKCVTVEI